MRQTCSHRTSISLSPQWRGQPERTTGCHHTRASKGMVLGHQRCPYKEVLGCLLLSMCCSLLLVQPCPWPLQREAREGKRIAAVTQHAVGSQKQPASHRTPCPMPPGKTCSRPHTILSDSHLWCHEGSAQEGLTDKGLGALPKRWVTHLSEVVWPGALLTALSMNSSICPAGWLAAQRWGGGKIMNKEFVLTKDPVIKAQLKEIKKMVFSNIAPPTGDFFLAASERVTDFRR